MTVATPPKTPSQAIRAGALKLDELGLRQIRGAYSTTTGCCALGVAVLGVGYSFEELQDADDIDVLLADLDGLDDLIPNDQLPEVVRGQYGFDPDLESVVIRLNDQHNWSLGQIAEWLESIGR